jgi:hypothetical protein
MYGADVFQNHTDLSMHIQILLFEIFADEISAVGSNELTNLSKVGKKIGMKL